jgi:hypothetical protein
MTPDLVEVGGPIDSQNTTITAMADEVDSQDPDYRFELEHIRLSGYVQYMNDKPPTPRNKKMPFIAEIGRQRHVRTPEELDAYLFYLESHGKEPRPCCLGTIGTRANLTTIFVSLRPEQYDRMAALAQQQALKGLVLTYRYEIGEDRLNVTSLTVSTDPDFMAIEFEGEP